MTVDGWAQAWRLPEGDGGIVVIFYAPQRSYLVSLFGGLAVAALVLLAAALLLFRTRLDPPQPIQARMPRPWSRPMVGHGAVRDCPWRGCSGGAGVCVGVAAAVRSVAPGGPAAVAASG